MGNFFLPTTLAFLFIGSFLSPAQGRRLFDPHTVDPSELTLDDRRHTHNDRGVLARLRSGIGSGSGLGGVVAEVINGAHAGPVIPDDLSVFRQKKPHQHRPQKQEEQSHYQDHIGQDVMPDVSATKRPGGPTLPDVLGRERALNIFASLTRSLEAIETRLNDHSLNSTILAPSNAVLRSLQRKPWESGDDYAAYGEADAYAGASGEGRATRNLKHFVELHVLPHSPWPERTERRTLGGAKVSWERRPDGTIMVSLRLVIQTRLDSSTYTYIHRSNLITSKLIGSLIP